MRSHPDRFAELAFYAAVVLIGYLAYIIARPFLPSLAWAAILAVVLYPLFLRIASHWGETRAALITTLAAAILLAGPVITLASWLARDLPRAVEYVQTLASQASPGWVESLWDTVRASVPFDLPEDYSIVLRSGAQTVAAYLGPRLGAIAANVVATLWSIAVMLFALFFLLRDSESIGDLIRRILPFDEAQREQLIMQTRRLVIASVGAMLLVATVQGAIGGFAFWMLGVAGPIVWGMCIAVCAVIPVVGSAIIWAPMALWWILSGDIARGLILAAVGAGIISSVDNLLRPLILSGRAEVNALVIFIGVLGGVAAFGFVGVVVGPVVLVTAATVLDVLSHPRPARPVTPE